MSNGQKYENLVLGSGAAGRLLTWTLASASHRTALVERGLLGGACPKVACMPSKNIIHSAKVAALARRGAEFGLKINSLSIDMAIVQRRKRMVVAGLQEFHLNKTVASGDDLFRGESRFVSPRTIESPFVVEAPKPSRPSVSLWVHERQYRRFPASRK